MKKNLTLYFALICLAIAFASCSRKTGCYYSIHNTNNSSAHFAISNNNKFINTILPCHTDMKIEDNVSGDENHTTDSSQ